MTRSQMPVIQADRLRDLIEFAQQTALLRSSPVADVSRYGDFLEYEHSISSLPGLHFDVASGEGEDEIWLVVERVNFRKRSLPW